MFKFPEYSTEEVLSELEIDGELPYPYLVALPYLVTAKVLLIDSCELLKSLHVSSVHFVFFLLSIIRNFVFKKGKIE
jgi:hypothetical protein